MHLPKGSESLEISETSRAPVRSRKPSGTARQRTLVQYAILVVIVIALAVVLAGCIRTAQQAIQGPRIGEFTIQPHMWRRAPPSASQTIHRATLRGAPVVGAFWASWRDACRAEAALREQTWRHDQSQGSVCIGIDVDDRQADAVACLQHYGITYRNGPDVTQAVAVRYAVPGLPITLFINRKSVVAGRHSGQLDQQTLAQAMATLLHSMGLATAAVQEGMRAHRAGRGRGGGCRTAGRTATARRASTWAVRCSVWSVLACRPVALATCRTWRGVTTTTGRCAAAKLPTAAHTRRRLPVQSPVAAGSLPVQHALVHRP